MRPYNLIGTRTMHSPKKLGTATCMQTCIGVQLHSDMAAVRREGYLS